MRGWQTTNWGPVFESKIVLGHSHGHPFSLVNGCSHAAQHSWVVVTETTQWLTKPKVFILCPFVENVGWPLI